MSIILSVKHLSVRYGGVQAVDDLSFEMPENELLGLIGPNGAGKTTVMRALTGAVTPAAGELYFRDTVINDFPTHRRIRLGIGLSQQIVKPFTNMTALQNVAFAAGHAHTGSVTRSMLSISRVTEQERAHRLLQRVGIERFADVLPGELPLGILKRLELARALALSPKLVLLDEPLAGLNHLEASAIADTIAKLVEDGLSVILIEHNLGEVVRICSRLVVIDNGSRIALGPPESVMSDEKVRAAYLGTQ